MNKIKELNLLKYLKPFALGIGVLSILGILSGLADLGSDHYSDYVSGAITVAVTLPVLMLSAILWASCEIAERLPEPQRLPQGMTSAQMPVNMYPAASAPAGMQNPTAAPANMYPAASTPANMQNPTAAPAGMQNPTAAPDIKQ
ncbi:hypothetical protein [Corynebacterium sp. HS2168-gen11]|uniref:hypothetical protein n=1 Tax=Corynebacterium sp. HS2168-gen11 TaxID=2974027 RepID=UPI00216AD0A3|nr:hypothetical protein [Corynebacterium sp. HS2168-gen11]MCS4535802.1 hypothetical protein [Corynebacterium sp. HS2168-gen11]